MERLLPTSVQSFEKIKTRRLCVCGQDQVCMGACPQKEKFFLSRSGRFGKSLFVSTENLYQKYNKPVVILVDEYDNPLLKAGSKDQEMINRSIYKSFFSVLKDEDRYLKMAFFYRGH